MKVCVLTLFIRDVVIKGVCVYLVIAHCICILPFESSSSNQFFPLISNSCGSSLASMRSNFVGRNNLIL